MTTLNMMYILKIIKTSITKSQHIMLHKTGIYGEKKNCTNIIDVFTE